MNTAETFKAKLLAACFEYVEKRMETSRQAMWHAQGAANAEEKSSAGDKYETGRAMAQIERDKAAYQLVEALKLKSMLNQINPIITNNKVVQGSLVITETTRFFLAISMGKVTLEGKDFLVIAPTSPIGQMLLNLAKGDQFTFNKQIHIIQEIL